MNFQLPTLRWAALPARIRGMFSLNDPRWGRGDDKPAGDTPPPNAAEPGQAGNPNGTSGANGTNGTNGPNSGHSANGDGQTPGQRGANPGHKTPQGPNGGPPDLDELWRDFNQKLAQLFGNKGPTGRPPAGRPSGGGTPGGQGPGLLARLGLGVILGAALLVWLGTGFFIVQEGQQAVITQFGKYKTTVGAGFNWRMPWPVQRHELVYVSQIRSVDIGRDNIIKATGLRESAMLTEDENIVEIKFAVQYRLNDARAYLFESKNPTEAVVQAAETAVREVVGKMKMDSALAEERDQIATRVRQLMQTILDRYKVGIEVVGINLQQGGVRPPEQVQAAFDDVLKAGQERERAKNEAQAYANDVVPRAVGAASRLKEEASAYRERIVAQAEGDAQRFKSILPEYQKAPQVTRDRLYTETLQQVYSNVTKVLVDSKQGSNLLYLPLDKIMQQASSGAAAVGDNAGSGANQVGTSGAGTSGGTPSATTTLPADVRSRENQRSRERDVR